MRLHKLTVILLMSLLSLASAAGAPRAAPSAATECLNGICTIFLPALRGYDIRPQLIAPADGQQIDSLAPLLTWLPADKGVYQIQLSQDPSFSPSSTMELNTTKSVYASEIDVTSTKLSSNLTVSSVYHWRVGYKLPEGYTYSPTYSFTTPAAVTLPGTVTLLSPQNNARLQTQDVTLTWQALPEALYYRVRVYYPNGDRFSSNDVAAPATSLQITGLPAKTVMHWRVKVLGTTGWSDSYSSDFFFTTP